MQSPEYSAVEVNNALVPNDEQMAGFAEPDDGRAIFMVNLLKYRERATYADGRDAELSGRDAYARYSEAVAGCLATVGGSIVFSGAVRRLMLGEVEDLWDDVAIAMYPSRKAMLDMMLSPEYQAIVEHRSAGLAGQLNIETVEGFPGATGCP